MTLESSEVHAALRFYDSREYKKWKLINALAKPISMCMHVCVCVCAKSL